MTLTIKLDRNWSSFQLANSAPPLSVTDSAIAPSARMVKHRHMLASRVISAPPRTCPETRQAQRVARHTQYTVSSTQCAAHNRQYTVQWAVHSRHCVLHSTQYAVFGALHTVCAQKEPHRIFPRRVCCAWLCAMPVQHVRLPEQARGESSPKKNGCDKQVSSWRHISCHTDKNRYYT